MEKLAEIVRKLQTCGASLMKHHVWYKLDAYSQSQLIFYSNNLVFRVAPNFLLFATNPG